MMETRDVQRPLGYGYETPRGWFAARVASAIRESLPGIKRRLGTAAQKTRGVPPDVHRTSGGRTEGFASNVGMHK
jgi:hypothetical protein